MYWPIGAPKVYALSKSAPPKQRILETHDGLQEKDTNGTRSSGAASTVSSEDIRNGSDTLQQSEAALQASVASNFVSENDARRGGEAASGNAPEIVAMKVSRGGSMFATITRTTLTVWQTKPATALASVIRSPQSLKKYGPNSAVLLRPDALIVVVQTRRGYLITYSMTTDPSARVYCMQVVGQSGHARRQSVDGYKRSSVAAMDGGAGESERTREVSLRFRMVIRIDAGIALALALDDELIVATERPSAVQCIRWAPDSTGSQTSTELLSRLPWLAGKTGIVDMVYDRPMSLSTWATDDGRAYAVQRVQASNADGQAQRSTFQGYCFHEPRQESDYAIKTAVNARFSLVAAGCNDGCVDIYTAKDYTGSIPLSHKTSLPVAPSTTGGLTVLSYSPDGYCLFTGYERGWAIWSVYGKLGANSFGSDNTVSNANDESYLQGIRDAFWIGGGSEIILLGQHDDRLWVMDMARCSMAGCFSPANISRSLLQTSNSVLMYRGHEVPDLTSLPADMSLWQTIQIPSTYLVNQWPIKSTVISADGKYVAVAGRRGLAHYSVASGRWKTFDDLESESEFAIRGGMCWHQHILIASVEASNSYQLRLYSRDKPLDSAHMLHVEELSAPVIHSTITGVDSLLVYTFDNTLCHYLITATSTSVNLVQVGQIAFHGIIRAPARVRAVSWILPDDQLEHGDPSQDVATASVLFLVDGKLVLLQPSTNEYGELKYDMRVIANNVEYYSLLRDQSPVTPMAKQMSMAAANGAALGEPLGHSLRDSLWFFDGKSCHVWSDIQDVLASAPADLGRELPPTVSVPTDFYPLSTIISKGIVHGLDPDLVQRRDINFSFFRLATRTQLFLPQLLQHHLSEYNSPAALHLSQSYEHLPYFPHALEVLLHDILDYEVDNPPSPPETALLPTAISFLSSFPSYLDIIVNCTRKTELRNWRTLFAYLPPVLSLLEESLAQDKLKTAAGYLLVLHTSEQESFDTGEFARVMRRASEVDDWDLCGELGRFLMGIDATGSTLRAALMEAGMSGSSSSGHTAVVTRKVNGDSDTRASQGRVADGQADASATIAADRVASGPQFQHAARRPQRTMNGFHEGSGIDD